MSPGTVTSERRKKSRQRPLSLVYVELAHQNGGMMRDLSEEGFAVRTMMPVRVGDATLFSFSLNETIRIEGEGTVVWVQDKGRVVGVKFIQLSSAMRTQIYGWLNGSGNPTPLKSGTVAEVPTLEQLRDELRASPARSADSHRREVPVSAAPAESAVPAEDVRETTITPKAEEAVVSQQVHETGVQAKPEIEAEPLAETEPMAVPEDATAEPEESESATSKEAETAESARTHQAEHEPTSMVMESASAGPQSIVNEPAAVPAEESTSTEETAPVLSEVLQAEEIKTVADTPPREMLASEPGPAAADSTPAVPEAFDTGALKRDSGSLGKKVEPTPISVSSLFKPVSESTEEYHERHQTQRPTWRADGQLPQSESTTAATPADAHGGTEIPIAYPRTPRKESTTEEEQIAPPRTAPNLPRLALRLNAADYAKQGFPFAVGPLPSPPPDPRPEEPPKRFWAASPPAESREAEERPLSAALREAFTGSMAASAPLREQMVQQEGHHEDTPILPDISSILIQPSGATPHEISQQTGATEPVRPWPGQLPKKESWAENFTLPRAVGIMLLLALALGIYTYRQELGQGLIWFGELLSGKAEVHTQSEPQASDQDSKNAKAADSMSSPAPASSQEPGQSPRTTEQSQNVAKDNRPTQSQNSLADAAPTDNVAQTPLPTKPKYTIQRGSAGGGDPASIAAPEANVEAGQSEYEQAMQMLRGRYPSYSQAEAVRLLWAAVEKGNPNAELALADMYWHGKGVPRNCDQTRILLTAASRKGSTEAQRRLQEFQQEGCE